MPKVQARKKSTSHSRSQRVAQRGEELRERITKGAEETAIQSRRRAAKLALAMLELERVTFDNTFKLIDKLQKQSEEMVKEHVGGAAWMPEEGKIVLEEWTWMLRHSRAEFLKTVDKSFSLMTRYIERLDKAAPTTKKSPTATAKSAAAAAPARKRVTPKKVKRTPAAARAGAA